MTAPITPDSRTWAGLLTEVLAGRDLSEADTAWAMDRIIRGEATVAQTAGLVAGLRAKGETAAELCGLVSSALAHATRVQAPAGAVDIAGTGGDRTNAVNISTMAAVVAAAAGVPVVKHGGRAASAASAGAADLVEHLGIPLELTAVQAARVVAEAGITFLFAPRFNPGLRRVGAVRRELAVPTAFNILGPLVNPADPRHQVVGVAAAEAVPLVVKVLTARGRRALVVRGQDGLDKFTTGGESRVWVVREGRAEPVSITPEQVGLPRSAPGALRGGGAAENARVLRAVLAGQRGPVRDVVLLNAAAALVSLDPEPDRLAGQLADGIARCAEAIDSGAASSTVDRWIRSALAAAQQQQSGPGQRG